MVLFSDKEAQPLRVREPVVVERVVSRVHQRACMEETGHPPASSSVVRRVVGGFLSATGHMVTLLIRIGVSAVTLSFRIRRFLGGVFIG